MSTEPLAALKADDADELDFWGNDMPKCPHCGHDCNVDRLEWYSLYEDNDSTHEKDCPKCELEFEIRTRIRYSFDTDKQP